MSEIPTYGICRFVQLPRKTRLLRSSCVLNCLEISTLITLLFSNPSDLLYKVVPFVGQIGQKRNKLVKKEQAKCVACSLLCGIFEEREHGKGNKLVKKGTGYNPESEKKDTSYNRTCIKMKIFLAYVRIFV